MSKIWTIARREYRLYFATPVAYVVAAVLLFVVGLIFYSAVEYGANPQNGYVPGIDQIYPAISFILIFAVPAITMRVISEEHRLGTIELLLTAPVKDWEVVVGKWLGALLFILTTIALTFVYPMYLNNIVVPGIDQGPLISGYLGLVMLSSAFVAIGVAVSSMFNNQVASLFASMGIFLVLWWLIGIPAQLSTSGMSEILRYLEFEGHFSSSIRGVINLGDMIYFASITLFSLVAGSVSLETRRWR
ncbi:MAG: ABC transporter permease [Anaerolineae bacterium]|nr:ABC transporter permease [Anaerolineae bacterium]